MSNKLLIITGISISISVLLMKEILYLKRDLKQLTNKIVECEIKDKGEGEENNVAEEKGEKEREEKEQGDKGVEEEKEEQQDTNHSDYELLEMDDNKEGEQDQEEDGKGDKDYYNLLFDIVKGRIGNFVS